MAVDLNDSKFGNFVITENMNVEEIVENLVKRYERDHIYTYFGQVCVAINPFRTMEIHDEKYVNKYKGKEPLENPPHIFAIADASFKNMKDQIKDTCIILNGESGSGKSECSKKILEYFAILSNQNRERKSKKISNCILHSNIILNAFGTAKTNQNDSASRFIKYMDLHFDYKGFLIGAHIKCYLLEKSRIVVQRNGERSFSCFYQLLKGTSERDLKDLGLQRRVIQYFYLNQGHVASSSAQDINDQSEFHNLNSSLDILQFSNSDKNTLWRMVASIIHLGNIEFEFIEDQLSLKSSASIGIAAKLLHVRRKHFETVLCESVTNLRGDIMIRRYTKDEAVFCRNTFAKTMYERLFNWILEKINIILTNKSYSNHHNILLNGILDLYGFENLSNNSFEQLCINYCNEKMQQLFLKMNLKEEIEEFGREEPVNIDGFKNQVICDLFEDPSNGIFAIVDDACKIKTLDDTMLLETMDTKLKDHKHYVSKQTKPLAKYLKHKVEFRINHYAGDVTYSISGILEKNKDAICHDFKSLLYNSKDVNIKAMWSDGAACNIPEISKRSPTAVNMFRNSIQNLMKTLISKTTYYIYCIKPNDTKFCADIDHECMKRQIINSGLIRIKSTRFAYQQTYVGFLKRYKMISQFTWPIACSSCNKDNVQRILTECHLNINIKFGTTKLYMKSFESLLELEKIRRKFIPGIVTIIQKTWRGYKARQLYLKMKALIKMIELYRLKRVRCFINELNNKFLETNLINEYGKRIIWPDLPDNLSDVLIILRKVYNRWRWYIVLYQVPKSEWTQTFALKIMTVDILYPNRRYFGVKRKWRGNYLANRFENSEHILFSQSVNNLRHTYYFNTIFFSSYVLKFNKLNRTSKRVLLITDEFIFKLDSKKFRKRHSPIAIADLTGISITSGQDQLMVLHYPKGNDMVVSLQNSKEEDRIGEAVGVICSRYQLLCFKHLPVNVSKTIQCCLGGKQRNIITQLSAEIQVAKFKKVDNNVLFIHPLRFIVLETGFSNKQM